jgi:hypothetical protein
MGDQRAQRQVNEAAEKFADARCSHRQWNG